MGIFLKRTDMACMFYVLILLQQSMTPEVQNLQVHVFRLLAKKMRLCKEFNCWPNPENGIQYFFQCLADLGLILKNVIFTSDLT